LYAVYKAIGYKTRILIWLCLFFTTITAALTTLQPLLLTKIVDSYTLKSDNFMLLIIISIVIHVFSRVLSETRWFLMAHIEENSAIATGAAFGAAEGIGSLAVKAFVEDLQKCNYAQSNIDDEIEKLKNEQTEFETKLKELVTAKAATALSGLLIMIGVVNPELKNYDKLCADVTAMKKRIADHREKINDLLAQSEGVKQTFDQVLASRYGIKDVLGLGAFHECLVDRLNCLRETAAQLSTTFAQRLASMKNEANGNIHVGQGVHVQFAAQQPNAAAAFV
jgi:hypothetical protein